MLLLDCSSLICHVIDGYFEVYIAAGNGDDDQHDVENSDFKDLEQCFKNGF